MTFEPRGRSDPSRASDRRMRARRMSTGDLTIGQAPQSVKRAPRAPVAVFDLRPGPPISLRWQLHSAPGASTNMTTSIPDDMLDLFDEPALGHVSFFIEIDRVSHSGTWSSWHARARVLRAPTAAPCASTWRGRSSPRASAPFSTTWQGVSGRGRGHDVFVPHEQFTARWSISTPAEIFEVDVGGVRDANLLFAWLDGPMVDDGTACEIGDLRPAHRVRRSPLCRDRRPGDGPAGDATPRNARRRPQSLRGRGDRRER